MSEFGVAPLITGNGARSLGKPCDGHGVTATVSLGSTDDVTAHIRPSRRRTTLAQAVDDVMPQVSLAEILLDHDPLAKEAAEVESPVHAAVLL